MSRFLSTGLTTLSSLRNQLSEFTSEVLTESTQEVTDPVAELSLAKKRVEELEQLLETRTSEVDKLRAANAELEERAHVFEYQLRQVAERHKDVLREKEAEILRLQSISLADVPTSSASQSHRVRDSTDDELSPPFSPTAYEFETRKLKEEVKQLKAECQHWKQLVKRDQSAEAKKTSGDENDESKQLRLEIMELRQKLDELVENHQNELAALQEVHRDQLATFARSYGNKQHHQVRDDTDDGWGAGADWESDEWNPALASADRPPQPTAAAGNSDQQELLELENCLATVQLENKRLHKLVDDLRKDETELARLQDENAELQNSLEALDAEHTTAIGKLLSDRKQAEATVSELKRDLTAVKEELAKATAQVAVGAEGTILEDDERLKAELQRANDTIVHLQTESSRLLEQLEIASSRSRQELEKIKAEYDSRLDDSNSRLRQTEDEKSDLRQQIDQLTSQCRELSVAYEDLNGQYEREKAESGAVVGSNHDLREKLEALKRDLIEYEEKYERCKRDNSQAMQQLDSLTGELERLKTEYFNASAAHAQSKKWHSEIVRLSKELEESLKKREELVKNIQDFQNIVDRFDQQIQRFRSENEQLKKENEELRVASGASSPNDFRRVFEDTDQELQNLRRSLGEYQETLLKKEKAWRDQMEALKEENETLKTRTPSTPGSGRDSDSGGEASSSGSASYVHVDVAQVDRSPDGDQQPSPEGSSGSAGLSSESALRRESQDSIVVDEEMAVKSIIEQQRQTIVQLEESNRRLKAQILQLTTENPAAFQDDHQTEPEFDSKKEEKEQSADESDNGEWNDWGEEAETERRQSGESSKPKSTFSVEQQQQQMEEVLEALSEKTEECETLNQELEQKRKELKEREELVQQVFTELKGLELQLADNRKREEELRNEVTKLTVELHRQKEEANSATKMELEILKNEKEAAISEKEKAEADVEKFKTELDEKRTTIENLHQQLDEDVENLRIQLEESRSKEEFANSELNRLRSNLHKEESTIGDDYQRLRSEYEKLKSDNDELLTKFSKIRSDRDQLELERQNLMLGAEDRLREQSVRYRLELDRSTLQETLLRQELDRVTAQLEQERLELGNRLEQQKSEDIDRTEEIEKWRRTEAEFETFKAETAATFDALTNEKQQLTALLTEKHQECLRYYDECQRLARLLAEEQTKSEILARKAETAARKPASMEAQSQTEVDDEEVEVLKGRLQEVELQLQISREDIDQKSKLLIELKNRLKSEHSERENFARRELQQAVQAKDRAVGEMAATRQHSESLQQQLRTSEEACQKQSKEIERLRAHLLQIEEAYTQEAVKSEERETELRRRLREAEQQLESNLEYAKDGSRKMADQLSDLHVQLQSMAEQRDAALLQYADSQIDLEKQQKALANLQTVLQHLQQERDAIVSNEVKRYKQEADIVKEQKRQLELQFRDLQKQILEHQEKINASSAVTEQASAKEKLISDLKAEMSGKDDQCAMLQSKLNELQRMKDAKIDKDVLKNIFLGYFCAPANKKPEVAHLLGAILGFSNDEFRKIEYGAGSGGWLQFLHLGGGGGAATTAHGAKSAEQSITAQFVKFLENESAPKSPAVAMSTAFASDQRSMTPGFSIGTPSVPDNRTVGSATSRSSTPGLNLELPTFASPLGDASGQSAGAGGSSDFLRDLLSKSGSDNVI